MKAKCSQVPRREEGGETKQARLACAVLPCLGPWPQERSTNAGAGEVRLTHHTECPCPRPVPGQSNDSSTRRSVIPSPPERLGGPNQTLVEDAWWAASPAICAIDRFSTHYSTSLLTFCTFICTSEQRITNTSVGTLLQVFPLRPMQGRHEKATSLRSTPAI